jgi:hypothetical protein
MKIGKSMICFAVLFVFIDMGLAASKDYQYVGSKETEQLEGAFRNKMAGYNCAFWPRPEKRMNAVSGKDLPEAYKDAIRKWIPCILNPSLMPIELDPNSWLGIRKLYFDRNYIIGRFSSGSDPNTIVEFKGSSHCLDITIQSKNLFDKLAGEISNEKVRGIISNIVRIPAEKFEKIEIKSNIEKMADVEVCYGKMFCEWTEKSNPFESERRWWSYIPFWYKEGTLFISVTTIEKDELPHATTNERWPF